MTVDGHGRSARCQVDRPSGEEQSRPPHNTLFSRGRPRKSREASDPKKTGAHGWRDSRHYPIHRPISWSKSFHLTWHFNGDPFF
eukprot:scaffold9457_cov86-Cyclotella_meneghiniana.AAC.1